MHGSDPTQHRDSPEPATPDEVSDPGVWRETTIAATPAEIWELLESEEGRERWLEPDPTRTIEVERSLEPERVIWRWRTAGREDHRVEIILVPAESQTRVIVIESVPSLPLAALSAAATCTRDFARRWTLALA